VVFLDFYNFLFFDFLQFKGDSKGSSEIIKIIWLIIDNLKPLAKPLIKLFIFCVQWAAFLAYAGHGYKDLEGNWSDLTGGGAEANFGAGPES